MILYWQSYKSLRYQLLKNNLCSTVIKLWNVFRNILWSFHNLSRNVRNKSRQSVTVKPNACIAPCMRRSVLWQKSSLSIRGKRVTGNAGRSGSYRYSFSKWWLVTHCNQDYVHQECSVCNDLICHNWRNAILSNSDFTNVREFELMGRWNHRRLGMFWLVQVT